MAHKTVQIILADDDADDRMLFESAVRGIQQDIVLELCADGTELMGFLDKRDESSPRIIFLDLNMADKSGMECLREIRAKPALGDIFVAIFSTSSAPSDVAASLRYGADVFIVKPNSLAKIRKVITGVIEMAEGASPISKDRNEFLWQI